MVNSVASGPFQSHPKVLVIGCGNPSRGDDALGPELLSRLEAAAPRLARRCELEALGDFQLQVEHALDLRNRDLVLFVDASEACKEPFTFQPLWARRDTSYTTHALSPSAVLHAYRELHGEEPPPCFLLSIRGLSFQLGEPLGVKAAAHLEAAWDLLRRLIEDPRLEVWEDISASQESHARDVPHGRHAEHH